MGNLGDFSWEDKDGSDKVGLREIVFLPLLAEVPRRLVPVLESGGLVGPDRRRGDPRNHGR